MNRPVINFQEELDTIKADLKSAAFHAELKRTRNLLCHKPIILYGAGRMGVSAAAFFHYYGIKVTCFCDKHKVGIEEETGLPIISPQILAGQYPDGAVVICSVNYKDEIIRDLGSLGINPKQIFTKDRLALHEITWEDIEPHIQGYKRAFDLLNDSRSKQVLLERIKCCLTSSPMTSSPEKEQYFDPEIITMSGEEIFVDGGMYTGDTAEKFFSFTGKKYKHYYGFEPDKKNYQAAYKNLYGKPDVTISPKGLWSSDRQLAFSGSLSSSSKLDEGNGAGFVKVTSLDSYFFDKAPPTFIKMDIEGAELEALKGAEHIIRSNKPKLAICAYHKPEDLYTLPELIMSYRSDYKFYLRHYTESIYETVLYAV